MKFIDKSIDLGAPEYCVTGIAAVERISAGQVRVSYFTLRKTEVIEVVHTVWDATEWRRTCEMISRVCEGVLAEPAPGRDDRPSSLAH